MEKQWRIPLIAKRPPELVTRAIMRDDICNYLEYNGDSEEERRDLREKFYEACGRLLPNRAYRRILFYLPLGALRKDAPEDFKRSYIDAWHELLNTEDVRENFHEGDVFEMDARPIEGLERVVKAAHLTPWLVQNDYLSLGHIYDLICELYDDGAVVALNSFRDAMRMMRERRMYYWTEEQYYVSILKKLEKVPERVRQEPLYVSKKRREWLAERGADVSRRKREDDYER